MVEIQVVFPENYQPKDLAAKEAMFKMQYAPQDSIPSHMVYDNLNKWRR